MGSGLTAGMATDGAENDTGKWFDQMKMQTAMRKATVLYILLCKILQGHQACRSRA